MRRAAAAIAAAVLLVPGKARAETLGDALVLAYRNSNLLEQNQAVLRAADEDVATAVAALRPVFRYIADGGYVNDAFRDETVASVSLDAQMTLFDFGRNRLGIDIAKETVLATREALVDVEQNVLLQAVIAYMQVVSAEENVRINENSVRVNSEELRSAQDRFELGEVTRTDVAQAEAQLAASRADLVLAEGNLTIAREAYRSAVGQYPGALAPPPRPPTLPGSVDEAKATAQRTHPLIRQAQYQVSAAELTVQLAVANRKPAISGGASVGYDTDDVNSSSLSLRLSQDLYTGGALSAAQRQAIAFRDQTRASLLQTALLVAENVGSSWASIDARRAQITAVENQIEAATIAYEGVREEASLGARTTQDVLDAEQRLLEAQASLITAQTDLQVAIYSLLSSMGLLTVDYLNLGIPTYDPSAYYEAVRNAPATSIQGESLDRVLRAIGKN
jgi:outer membrane protein